MGYVRAVAHGKKKHDRGQGKTWENSKIRKISWRERTGKRRKQVKVSSERNILAIYSPFVLSLINTEAPTFLTPNRVT